MAVRFLRPFFLNYMSIIKINNGVQKQILKINKINNGVNSVSSVYVKKALNTSLAWRNNLVEGQDFEYYDWLYGTANFRFPLYGNFSLTFDSLTQDIMYAYTNGGSISFYNHSSPTQRVLYELANDVSIQVIFSNLPSTSILAYNSWNTFLLNGESYNFINNYRWEVSRGSFLPFDKYFKISTCIFNNVTYRPCKLLRAIPNNLSYRNKFHYAGECGLTNGSSVFLSNASGATLYVENNA